jgi:hypothetical protein
MFEFTIALATHRCNPHVISWSGTLFPANAGDPRRRVPLPPARAPPLERVRPTPTVGSGADGPDPTGHRVKRVFYRLTRALLLKRPLVSLILQAGPSTSKNLYRSVLNFMFKPLILIDFHTKGPEQPFYDLNLLFLRRISF